MSPFDREHMTSYWRSMALSRVVWDIQWRKIIEKLSWPWYPGQRSHKVIESGTVR